MPSLSVAADPVLAGLVRTTIAFYRTDNSGGAKPVRLVPESCAACVQRDEPAFARENARQTIVELDVPIGRVLEPAFTTDPNAFDRAVLQSRDLPLARDGNHLRIELPPVSEEATEAGEFVTHVVGTGYVLRFEHADPVRRFGAYAQAIPVNQRLAANNLEFAFRESVLELGLGAHVAADQLGTIEIMGFDTNEPHGHVDAPPHVHMHLRWPYNAGTQIGHFYLTPDGRIDHTAVGVAGLSMPGRTYARTQPFATVGPKRDVVYTQTVTADGAMSLSLPDGRSCQIGTPADDFRTTIHLHCSGHDAVAIAVHDDLDHGILTADTGTIREVFRYDPRTGRLLSSDTPPDDSPSSVSPTYALSDRTE